MNRVAALRFADICDGLGIKDSITCFWSKEGFKGRLWFDPTLIEICINNRGFILVYINGAQVFLSDYTQEVVDFIKQYL